MTHDQSRGRIVKFWFNNCDYNLETRVSLEPKNQRKRKYTESRSGMHEAVEHLEKMQQEKVACILEAKPHVHRLAACGKRKRAVSKV